MKQWRKFLRWAALPMAALLFAAGAITLLLPLPTGLMLIALGLGLAGWRPSTR